MDAFRYLHPDAKHIYTWWDTPKEKKVNKGRRLDYFLVPEEKTEGEPSLLESVSSVDTLEHFV